MTKPVSLEIVLPNQLNGEDPVHRLEIAFAPAIPPKKGTTPIRRLTLLFILVLVRFHLASS